MVCATRSFENINEETLKTGDVCEVGFQHMTDRQTLSMLPRNRREEKRVGRMRVQFVLS
jgi:hypothetical protein